jgi:hypothetical protein
MQDVSCVYRQFKKLKKNLPFRKNGIKQQGTQTKQLDTIKVTDEYFVFVSCILLMLIKNQQMHQLAFNIILFSILRVSAFKMSYSGSLLEPLCLVS